MVKLEILSLNRGQHNSQLLMDKGLSIEEIINYQTTKFVRRVNIKYCCICGNEINITDNCQICSDNNKYNKYLSGYVSEIIGGYIELSNRKMLKKYYDRVTRNKSKVKMNDKRIIFQLLLHKDKLVKKENEKKIQELINKIYNNIKT